LVHYLTMKFYQFFNEILKLEKVIGFLHRDRVL